MLLAADRVLSSNLTWGDWVGAAVVFGVAIVIGRVGRNVSVRAIGHGHEERAAAQVVGRMVAMVIVIGGFVYSLSVLGVRLGPLVGALGIGGVAIAFAAQSILSNFLASIILQIRRPFRHGDQIETNDCEGTVEDVNFRTVVLRTYDGQRVMVPCAQVLSQPIVNHTVLGRRRTTLEVGIGYDADPAEARTLLIDAVSRVDGVREQPHPEVWVESFGDSSVNLVVRYWHAPDTATLWRVRSGVAVAVKRALDGAGIDIPFPHRVLRFSDTLTADVTADHVTGSARDGSERDDEERSGRSARPG
jgi:small conductance mechanosensitive channel